MSSGGLHQFSDVTNGLLVVGGCLAYPGDGSGYDPGDDSDTDVMTRGPRGFLTYRVACLGYRTRVLTVGRVG